MTDIQALHTKIDFLTQQITDFRADFISKLLEKDKKINELETQLLQCQERTVQQEQRSRNYCIRVKGVRVDPDLERDLGHVKAAMDAVYSKVLLPLADSTLKLPGDVAEVLEVAHKLPQRGETPKGDKRPPPIIHVRFRSRELRNSILQKRDSLKGVSVDRNEKRMGVSSYWITQDLTTEVRNKIKETNEDDRVSKCYCTKDGKIRFTLKRDENVTIKPNGVFFNIDDYCK